jgi:RND family efflux transporter MFP subunit
VSTATKTPTPARGPAGARRPPWGWLALAGLALAAVAAGAWYVHGSAGAHAGGSEHGSDAEEGKAQAVGAPVAVETVRPTPGGIVRTSSQIGTVHPFEVAELYAKVSGYLKPPLRADYGDHVKRGQLLAEIDDPEIVKEAERAEAELTQSQAKVKQAEANVETAEADQKAAETAVEQAQAEVERTAARRTYRAKVLKRYQDLVRRKAVPQEVVDEYEDNYQSALADEHAAKAARATAESKAVAAKAHVTLAKADLAEARATVKVDEANLAKARVLVDYTRITSPYDGVVTDRRFFPGAFIRSAAEGSTVPLLTVARNDIVRVVTMVPDRDVPFVDVGDPAEVTLDALGSEVLKGKVSRFADTEDPTSRTMHTEIDLPNRDGRIRPGMYGIARIILDNSTRAATLPAMCLVGEAEKGEAEVFVVKDGKAERTKIRIGADDGLRVEVVSGLAPGDEVILRTTGVTDGMPVKAARAVASVATEPNG